MNEASKEGKLSGSRTQPVQPPIATTLAKEWKALSAVYGVALALLYQQVYWTNFSVKPTAYLGFQDLVQLAIPALATALALMLSMMAMFWLIAWISTKLEDRQFVRKAGNYSAVFLLGVLILAIWNFPVDRPTKPIELKNIPASVFLFLGLLVLGQLASMSAVFSDLMKGSRGLSAIQRGAALVALGIGPVIVATLAFANANEISSGTEYLEVVVEAGTANGLCGVSWPSDARYLGSISGYHFILVGKQTCIVRAEALGGFKLIPHSRLTPSFEFRLPLVDSPLWWKGS